jgi:hypothetical protein
LPRRGRSSARREPTSGKRMPRSLATHGTGWRRSAHDKPVAAAGAAKLRLPRLRAELAAAGSASSLRDETRAHTRLFDHLGHRHLRQRLFHISHRDSKSSRVVYPRSIHLFASDAISYCYITQLHRPP